MNKLIKSLVLSLAFATASYTPQQALVISQKTARCAAATTAFTCGMVPMLPIFYANYVGILPVPITLQNMVGVAYACAGAATISTAAIVGGLDTARTFFHQFTPLGILQWADKRIAKIVTSDDSEQQKEEQLSHVRSCLVELDDYLVANKDYIEGNWEGCATCYRDMISGLLAKMKQA
jgi:hypothetical protein